MDLRKAGIVNKAFVVEEDYNVYKINENQINSLVAENKINVEHDSSTKNDNNVVDDTICKENHEDDKKLQFNDHDEYDDTVHSKNHEDIKILQVDDHDGNDDEYDGTVHYKNHEDEKNPQVNNDGNEYDMLQSLRDINQFQEDTNQYDDDHDKHARKVFSDKDVKSVNADDLEINTDDCFRKVRKFSGVFISFREKSRKKVWKRRSLRQYSLEKNE